jgi:hypothetical protein
MDANVQMKDIVSAYSLHCSIPLSVETLTDSEFDALFHQASNQSVEKASEVNLNLSTMPALGLTTYLDYQGRVSAPVLLQLINRGRAGCALIKEQLKETIKNKLQL